MGYSNIKIMNEPLEGKILIAEGEARKGGAYIARITGTDPKYRYAREFISSPRQWIDKHTVRVFVHLTDLQTPFDLLEIRAGGSWKNDYRSFYLYDAVEQSISGISETTLREKLAEKLSILKQEQAEQPQITRRVQI